MKSYTLAALSLLHEKLFTLTVLVLCRKEKEIGTLQQGMEEQAAEIAALQRRVRELEAKIEELEEDLENERNNRNRVRRQ